MDKSGTKDVDGVAPPTASLIVSGMVSPVTAIQHT